MKTLNIVSKIVYRSHYKLKFKKQYPLFYNNVSSIINFFMLYKSIVGLFQKTLRKLRITKQNINEHIEICKCPVCTSAKATYLFSQKDSLKYKNVKSNASFDLVKCNECSMIYVNPRLKEKIIKAIYKNDLIQTYKYDHNKKISGSVLFKAYHAKLNERLSHFSAIAQTLQNLTEGRILEIGSSYGYFLNECKQRNFEVFGIEPSESCATFAHKELGLKHIHCGGWKDKPFPFLFDAICIFSTIEHLYDPRSCIKYIDHHLKKDGYLFISCPILKHELRFGEADPIEHINYFSEKTLKKIIKDAGNYTLVKKNPVFIFRKK